MPVIFTKLSIRHCCGIHRIYHQQLSIIVAGSLVGASGLILTFIMCKAMNRTLPDVLFKAFGGSGEKESLTRTKVVDADEVAMMIDGAQKVIIVPGYGMAVSQCQHQVKNLPTLC